jgi:hypothetical protein
MSSQLKRQLGYAAALAVCLAGFAFGKAWPGVQSLFAVASVAVLTVYVLWSDEVERALGLQASAAAFVLLLAAALALTTVEQTAIVAVWASDLWAVMVATALLCWVVLRIRLG